MSLERAAQNIKLRQRALEANAFSISSWDEFLKQKGIWQGLSDALSELADEARKDGSE